MAMGSLDRDTVNLVPGQLIMEESQDMPIFFMTNWRLKKHRFDSRKNGLRLVIIMKRKIISEMMTTYLPSTLLVAITFATTFFKPFFFEAALSVNLTTMLVMTTIFTIKIEELPPTSDHICEPEETDKDKDKDKAGKEDRKKGIDFVQGGSSGA